MKLFARRWPRNLLLVVVCFFALILIAAVYLLYAPTPPPPPLSSTVQLGTIRVGALDRSYLLYVPAHVPPSPPLVLVFHGSSQTGADIRVATGYEFDRLADEHGFVVVYPNGFEKNWNDCRKTASYPARQLNVDDIGFCTALTDRLRETIGTDPARVFAVGYSNGGHFAYRMALEHPDRVSAIAVFAASLPTDDNCDCRLTRKPVPVMIVNGTKDPINPFGGGTVTIAGFGNRGTVRSSRASAEYFAGLAGSPTPEESSIPAEGQTDGTWVEKTRWHVPGKAEVVLVAVHGGGHVIPQPVYRPQRILGKVSSAINGPAEVWSFFASLR
ncbi:alpha/beta hydrolase family esterase [Fimbriiglobus ruber]|uniref:LpqC n=1 Tax=Fimbriiglobus ruber TaxID=1908690 RepID=A0A225DJ02_9BACT|nr:PHB depolymerase family esterase [Fimbriiglobus ruber]OWK36355.1 LpqC [Fimbriiglobus ruber]